MASSTSVATASPTDETRGTSRGATPAGGDHQRDHEAVARTGSCREHGIPDAGLVALSPEDRRGLERLYNGPAIIAPWYERAWHNSGVYRFHRRGRIKVRLEWRLLMMAHNLTKVHRHQRAAVAT
jgi:hypothetical protein